MRKPLAASFRGRALVMIGLVLAGLIIGSAVTALTGNSVIGSAPGPTIVVAQAQQRGGTVSFSEGFWPAVQNTAPAVVNVFSQRVVRATDQGRPAPFFSDPFFRDFFGDSFGRNAPSRDRIERSLGSGVVVSSDGYIMTNAHVVEKAESVRVATAGGSEFAVKVVGIDPRTDIAVLKSSSEKLPTVTIADSSKVQVGDFALAIGNPFGVGQTVTQGIVSATGRGGLGIADYEDFIQTDAAINRGNSGGALVNFRGELIGINTAIISPTGGFQGIGFAVPANMARSVMEQIVKHGRVSRGWMGVSIQEVTPEIARAFGLKQERGVLVGDADPSGPAARAGLRRGDVILSVNGDDIEDPRALQLKIGSMQPGASVNLAVVRDGQQRQITLSLGEAPNEPERPTGQPGAQRGALEGVRVEQLTPQIARQLELPPGTQGVVVTAVAPGAPAAMAGLARGMVIQQVNRKPVTSVREFESLVRQAGDQPVVLLVNLRGSTRFVVVEPARK